MKNDDVVIPSQHKIYHMIDAIINVVCLSQHEIWKLFVCGLLVISD